MPRAGTREHEMFLNNSTNGAKRHEKGDFGQASKWATPHPPFQSVSRLTVWKTWVFQCDSRHRPEGFEFIPQNNPWLCIYDKPPKIDPTQLLLRKIKQFAVVEWLDSELGCPLPRQGSCTGTVRPTAGQNCIRPTRRPVRSETTASPNLRYRQAEKLCPSAIWRPSFLPSYFLFPITVYTVKNNNETQNRRHDDLKEEGNN